MTIVGCRIDGRLIHGQVANLWTTKLNVSRIMVIDDEVAQNDIEKSGLKLATPPGVKLSILPVAKAAENILAGKYDSQRLFIVARKPDRFLRLIEAGVQLETLNVGNMSQSDETRAITRSINVVDADVEDFNKIHEKGVKITIDNKEEKICRKYPSWSNLRKTSSGEKKDREYGYVDIQNVIRKYLENNTELTPLKVEFIIWPQMQLAMAEEGLFSQLVGAEKDYYETQPYHKILEKYDKKIPLPKQMGNNYKNRLNEWFRKLSVKEKTQCLNEMLTQISKVKQSGLLFEEI